MLTNWQYERLLVDHIVTIDCYPAKGRNLCIKQLIPKLRCRVPKY